MLRCVVMICIVLLWWKKIMEFILFGELSARGCINIKTAVTGSSSHLLEMWFCHYRMHLIITCT